MNTSRSPEVSLAEPWGSIRSTLRTYDLNHSRIQPVFCLKSKKKTFFVFGLGFGGGTAVSRDVLAVFGHLYLALDPNPLGHYFETRPKSASLEPLNDFLTYRLLKLWTKSKNLEAGQLKISPSK